MPPPPTTAHEPRRRALATATATVAALGLAVELVHARSHADWVEVLVAFLSLSYEANLPTWYASTLLAACAVSLAAIARRAGRGDRYRRHWWGLAALFAVMSLDEVAELHENLYLLVDGGGVFYFSWVIPGAAIAAAVGLVYLRFWLALPPASRRRFAVAGALYLTGALAMELPLGYWTERFGSDNATYAFIDFVEETLELTGATVFALALWRHPVETEVLADAR